MQDYYNLRKIAWYFVAQAVTLQGVGEDKHTARNKERFWPQLPLSKSSNEI
jgi:hypothetical protein